jgi:hypothetical protein
MAKSHRQQRKAYAKFANANAIVKIAIVIANVIADVMSH